MHLYGGIYDSIQKAETALLAVTNQKGKWSESERTTFSKIKTIFDCYKYHFNKNDINLLELANKRLQKEYTFAAAQSLFDKTKNFIEKKKDPSKYSTVSLHLTRARPYTLTEFTSLTSFSDNKLDQVSSDKTEIFTEKKKHTSNYSAVTSHSTTAAPYTSTNSTSSETFGTSGDDTAFFNHLDLPTRQENIAVLRSLETFQDENTPSTKVDSATIRENTDLLISLDPFSSEALDEKNSIKETSLINQEAVIDELNPQRLQESFMFLDQLTDNKLDQVSSDKTKIFTEKKTLASQGSIVSSNSTTARPYTLTNSTSSTSFSDNKPDQVSSDKTEIFTEKKTLASQDSTEEFSEGEDFRKKLLLIVQKNNQRSNDEDDPVDNLDIVDVWEDIAISRSIENFQNDTGLEPVIVQDNIALLSSLDPFSSTTPNEESSIKATSLINQETVIDELNPQRLQENFNFLDKFLIRKKEKQAS